MKTTINIKPTDIIQKGWVAYHMLGNKIDDLMVMNGDLGGYANTPAQQLVDDGWSFVCRTKRYKKGQKVNVCPWPKTPSKQSGQAGYRENPLRCPHCQGLIKVKTTLIQNISVEKQDLLCSIN